MAKTGKQGRVWILAAGGLVVLALVLTLEAVQGAAGPIYWVILTAALPPPPVGLPRIHRPVRSTRGCPGWRPGQHSGGLS